MLLFAINPAPSAICPAPLLSQGTSAFTLDYAWPPTFQYVFVVTRSPPYIAGMLAAVVMSQAGRLPTSAAPPPAAAADGEGAGKQGKLEGQADKPAQHGSMVVVSLTADATCDGATLDAAVEDGSQQGGSAANAFWQRAQALAHHVAAGAPRLDWPALLLCCGLAYSGVGMNR